ncbi:MAG: hypothetical protein ACXWQA_08910 [Pseudobdellovibrionaceae bacterium]
MATHEESLAVLTTAMATLKDIAGIVATLIPAGGVHAIAFHFSLG